MLDEMNYSFEKFTEDSGDDYPKYADGLPVVNQQDKINKNQLEFEFVKFLEIKMKKVSEKQ
jgi:hypothetical protein